MTTSSPCAARAGRAIGAMFFAFFGSAWLAWWCAERYAGAWPPLVVIAAGGAGLFVLALRQYRRHRPALASDAQDPDAVRARRTFNRVNGAQWAAVAIAALVLANTGHPEWIRVAIMFIVGMHFLPLAAAFRYRWHYATGTALILLAVVYPFATPAGALNPVGLLGAGLILWASALIAVWTPGATDS